jgi:Protein of unknown function (DUF1566)
MKTLKSALLITLIIGLTLAVAQAAEKEVWKDKKSGLTWQVKPTGPAMNWEGAKSHCSGLSLGDKSDWRMPTISELRSLIRGCPATEKGGSCRISDSCLNYRKCKNNSGVFTDNLCGGCAYDEGTGQGGAYWPPELEGKVTWYWSSSVMEKKADAFTKDVFYVGFKNADVSFNDTVERQTYVRCVR